MNLKQAEILLGKINSLYNSLDMDQGDIARIERDLMLSYLRQLYEVFHEDDQSNPAVNQSKAPERKQSRQTDTSSESRQRVDPKPEPLRRTYKPPRIIEIPESEKEPVEKESSRQSGEASQSSNAPTTEPQQQEPEKPRPEPKPTPKPDPQPSSQTKSDTPSGSPEIETLFEQRRATELSEKLSESPVNDLGKSLAINDRLLYMNELFGKNMNALDENLRQLNRYDSFREAKPLLVDLAKRYNWTDEERIDTAKSFIKLVRRRYL